jgi:hypothetical protein
MHTQTAVLYIKNSSSSHNFRLINYLKSYITRINQAGLRLKFETADEKNAEFYKENNIYGFPAITLNGNTVVGNQEIEAFLNNIISRKPTADNEEDVSDWLIKTITTHADGSRINNQRQPNPGQSKTVKEPDVDSDDEEDESKTLHAQIQKALRDRQKRDPKFGLGMHQNLPSPKQSKTPPAEEIKHQRPQRTQRPTRQPRPANISEETSASIQKVISQPKSTDDELLNKLFANQG